MKTIKAPAEYINLNYRELSNYLISADGKISIKNSGGTSSGEGGMGSGSKSSEEKGTVSTPDQRNNNKGNSKSDVEAGNTFDPLKKEIEKQEQKNKSEE